MVTTGEDVLVVDPTTALSQSTTSLDEDVVVHDPTTCRGDSKYNTGTDVVLVDGQLGQGPGQAFPLNEERLILSDTLVPVGTTVTLSINVVNSTDTDVSDYAMDFKENGATFTTKTADIPAGTEYEFSTTVTKNSVGQFEYQANRSNKVSVAWMNVDPGTLTASDKGVALHQGEDTTTLSITVSNPSSQDRDVRVDFREDGDTFTSQTATIAASGGSHTFSVDRTYTSVQEHSYDAYVVETGPEIGALSNSVGVRWYDETTAWDNIIVPSVIENGDGSNTTTFSSDSSKTQAGYLAEPEGDDGVLIIEWEDSATLPRDEQIIWDNSQWESGGYVRIEINHDASAHSHKNWVGLKSDGHYLGEHFDESGTADGEFDELDVFEGRCYNDGTITDLQGNEVGTWK